MKWALQASTQETASYLIEKGKRDARSWVVATGLDVVLAAEQHGDVDEDRALQAKANMAAGVDHESQVEERKEAEPVVAGLTGKPRTDTTSMPPPPS